MNCPACGTPGSSVAKTMEMGNHVLRSRQCECGAKWKTKEMRVKGTLVAISGPRVLSLPGFSRESVSDPDPDPGSEVTPIRARVERKTYQYSEAFEACWALYGRKDEKIRAYMAWKAMAPTVGGEAPLRDLVVAALSWQGPTWARDGWTFAKYFERYLKARKWEDERGPAAASSANVVTRDVRVGHVPAEVKTRIAGEVKL